MRYLATLPSALLLVGCGATSSSRGHSQPGIPVTDAPTEFLLTSAAADFHAHRPPYPARFRDVRIGYVVVAEGARQYLLRGDLLPAGEAGKPDWIPFVTIKTSGYEQWLGSQATGFCQRSSIVWLEGDLSGALQSRLDSP